MLLTRHYDQRPFHETVCNALIADGGVKELSKKVQNICDYGCIKHGLNFSCVEKQSIRLIQMNCLRLDRTTKMGSHINVCAIYGIQFPPMNCVLLGNAIETVIQIKVCVIYSIRFTRTNYFRLGKRTETVYLNKICVICGICDQPKEHKRFV